MLREQAKLISRLQILVDLSLTAGSFIGAYFIKRELLPKFLGGLSPLPNYYVILLLILLIWYPSLRAQRIYASNRARSLLEINWRVFKAVSWGMVFLLVAIFVLKIPEVSRIMLGIFFGLNLASLWAAKIVGYHILRRYRLKGFNSRNMLILGSGAAAKEVIDAVSGRNWGGYVILGCLNSDRRHVGMKVAGGVAVIGVYEDLEEILFQQVVDELVFATDLQAIPNVQKYVELADEMGIAIRVLPQWNIRRMGINPRIGALHYETFLGVPTLAITSTPEIKGEIVFKNMIDYTVAALGIILTLPVWVLAAVGIKLVSPNGPVLYRQTRVGQNGREFELYKFRTMVPDAERQRACLEGSNECDGPVFKLARDPRVLPGIGPLLRRPGLDELPQLLNVLKGELSIVGPRPPLPGEVRCYQYWQRRRLSMKPGITCFWQCQPNRNQISFEDWMKMDLAYIDNWSLWLDVKIMTKTFFAMARGAGR